MGAVIMVMGIISLGVLFAYFKFPPETAKPTQLQSFNKMVMIVCVMLCGAVFMNVRVSWMGSENEKWWLPVAIMAALGVEIVVLSICFVIRNFWMFKPPRRPGGF